MFHYVLSRSHLVDARLRESKGTACERLLSAAGTPVRPVMAEYTALLMCNYGVARGTAKVLPLWDLARNQTKLVVWIQGEGRAQGGCPKRQSCICLRVLCMAQLQKYNPGVGRRLQNLASSLPSKGLTPMDFFLFEKLAR